MSKSTVVPLDLPEKKILGLILPNRGPDSYFAGSATMADTLGRQPDDYDIHHPTSSALATAISHDRQAFEAGGGRCVIYEETLDEVRGRIELAGVQVKLDWVLDEEPRIFGPIPDGGWGYRLHPFDVAVHKILQAANCGANKDLADLLSIHKQLFPLAALAWAAPLRDPQAEPDRVLAALADWWSLRGSEAPNLKILLPKATAMLREARRICSQLPPEERGCIYFRNPIFPVAPSSDDMGCVAVRPAANTAGLSGNRTAEQRLQ